MRGMDYSGVEMDLSVSRQGAGASVGADLCKARQAKSVFSIRSLVDLTDHPEPRENGNADESKSYDIYLNKVEYKIVIIEYP